MFGHSTSRPRPEEAVLPGMAAILFGLALVVWPTITLTVVTIAFAAYALITGALALVTAYRQSNEHHGWMASTVEGIVGIVAGLAVLLWPGVSATIVAYVIAIWAILSAIPLIISAFTNRDWLKGAVGALLALLGITLLVNAGSSLSSLAWIIGVFAIAWGAFTLLRVFSGTSDSARA